ncbi:hypothetical protein SCLCIDRAFT_31201 [Scleroderma citrinum Foug A]|uniref:Uncharacterized protein n=1 Tax=Scleroderma citrinum Foug A TaxID=1036808 RepID=A0A0C3D0H6_9AGAM|nr:hypothetical protein SCLCIDRAFT_31201 [Scleroderma citrinum Foug A]
MINAAALVAVRFDWASPLMSIFTGLQVVPAQIPILAANWPLQVCPFHVSMQGLEWWAHLRPPQHSLVPSSLQVYFIGSEVAEALFVLAVAGLRLGPLELYAGWLMLVNISCGVQLLAIKGIGARFRGWHLSTSFGWFRAICGLSVQRLRSQLLVSRSTGLRECVQAALTPGSNDHGEMFGDVWRWLRKSGTYASSVFAPRLPQHPGLHGFLLNWIVLTHPRYEFYLSALMVGSMDPTEAFGNVCRWLHGMRFLIFHVAINA